MGGYDQQDLNCKAGDASYSACDRSGSLFPFRKVCMVIKSALSPSKHFTMRCPCNGGCEFSLFSHHLANGFVLVFMQPSGLLPFAHHYFILN